MAGGLAGGIAAGLESGLRIGTEIRRQNFEEERTTTLDSENRANKARENARADDELALRTQQQEREDAKAAVDSLTERRTRLAALTQPGSAPLSADELGSYATEAADIDRQLHIAHNRLSGEALNTHRANASRIATDAQDGKTDFHSLPADDQHNVLSTALQFDAKELLPGPNGEPSERETSADDFLTGLRVGDLNRMAKGAGGLFAERYQNYVGKWDPKLGGRVVDVKPGPVFPHPQDPSRILPSMELTVQHPSGAVDTAVRPLTTHGTLLPEDPPLAIPVQKAVERAGHIKTAASMAKHPSMGQPIADASGDQWAAQRDLHRWAAPGQPFSSNFKVQIEKVGEDLVSVKTDNAGNSTSTVIRKGDDRTPEMKNFEYAETNFKRLGYKSADALKRAMKGKDGIRMVERYDETTGTKIRVPVVEAEDGTMQELTVLPAEAPPSKAGTLPPHAASALKKGVNTTFGNGQVWTVGEDGQPKQVK